MHPLLGCLWTNQDGLTFNPNYSLGLRTTYMIKHPIIYYENTLGNHIALPFSPYEQFAIPIKIPKSNNYNKNEANLSHHQRHLMHKALWIYTSENLIVV
jgi:hypothetical protein